MQIQDANLFGQAVEPKLPLDNVLSFLGNIWSLQIQDINRALPQCWITVCVTGPTLTQQCVKSLVLAG